MKIFLCLVMALVVCGCKLRQEQHGEEKWGKAGKHLAKSAGDFAVLNKKIDAFLGLKGAYKESDLDEIFNALEVGSKHHVKARRAVLSAVVETYDGIDESVSRLGKLQSDVDEFGSNDILSKIINTEEAVLRNRIASANSASRRYNSLTDKIYGYNLDLPPGSSIKITDFEVTLRFETVKKWGTILKQSNNKEFLNVLKNNKISVLNRTIDIPDNFPLIKKIGEVEALVIDPKVFSSNPVGKLPVGVVLKNILESK